MEPIPTMVRENGVLHNTAVLRQDVHEMNGILWLEHTVYLVTQRTRELAVRLALGAQPAELLLLMVIRQGVAWTIVGSLLGVAGSIALSRYLQGVLFGITPADPATFAGASAMSLLVAILATCIPARRIAHVDPLVTLRTP